MLGNDVVDLEDPETRPETFRPRFDERVFDPTERRAIARDQNEHGRRWTHWAAKEAAYKLARQVDSKFVFSPSKLVARFTEDVDVA
ncbi:MAG: 4'-phosphopantetheinyl transferase family protein, partial [bacterium]